MSSDTPKVAIVTGGALRVGRAISLALHKNGYRVIIHYNTSKSEAFKLAEEMNSIRTDSAFYLQADLSKDVEPTCRTLVDAAVSKWQRLDVVVNNAANFYAGNLMEMTSDQFDRTMNVNLKSPSFIMQFAACHLQKQKGSIVNIVDIIGEFPTKSHFCYSISKASLIASTKSAAQLLAPEIRVNAIAPGCVEWPIVDEEIFDEKEQKRWLDATPMKRFGSPETVAQSVLFLISSEASGFITGHILRLDGGRSLAII